MTATVTPPLKQSGRNQRRQHYISGSFQRRFVLQFCALVIGGCVVFGMLLYVYASRTLTTAFVHSKLRVMSTADFLLPALGFSTVIVAMLVAIVAAARMVFLSHRIAGPLYRLEKTAAAIGNGDLSLQIRLRNGDELKALAKSMDGMVGDLHARVQEIQTQTRRLGDVIAQAKQQSAAPRELLEALQDSQVRLDEAISCFRV